MQTLRKKLELQELNVQLWKKNTRNCEIKGTIAFFIFYFLGVEKTITEFWDYKLKMQRKKV